VHGEDLRTRNASAFPAEREANGTSFFGEIVTYSCEYSYLNLRVVGVCDLEVCGVFLS
jgi:hypothetical protein